MRKIGLTRSPDSTHLALFLECIGQIAVCVRKVGLQFNGSPVCVNGQVNETLLVINARQVTVHNGIVG